MPINENLNVELSPAQETSINTAIDNITTEINAASADPLNLSDSERQSAGSIDNIRLPYASRAINEFGSAYPALNGVSITLARASTNFNLFNQMKHVELRLLALLDQVTDLKINAGSLVMDFTDDQYANAKRYRTKNVPGADTVYDAQNPLYDRPAQPDVIQP
jgi:hypothetical protein